MNNVTDYVARISNTNPVGLVAITYELILAHVGDAIAAHDDEEAFVRHVELSTELLGTLIDSLNMDYELSRTLFPLYIYVNKLLIGAKVTRRADSLADVRKILSPLYDGWRELAQSHTEMEPAMESSQKIFAGLTYGRGELNEYIEEDGDRSYKA